MLIHLLAIGRLRGRDWFVLPAELSPAARRVALEFVDSPERLTETEKPPDRLPVISDRDSRPQDTIPDHPDEDSEPRMVGPAEGRSIRKQPPGSRRGEEGIAGVPEPPRPVEAGRPAIQSSDARRGAERTAAADGPLPLNLDGTDEFWAPEADNPEGKARILKQAAYNARSHAVGLYLARLKPRLVNYWMLVVLNDTNYYIRSRSTSVLFKIRPDGTLGSVLLNQHDGPAWEVRYALRAVIGTAPYEPLNREILDYVRDDGLWLEFVFHY